MLVTKIEALGKNRNKVYLDEQLAFVLYKGELSRYKIKENENLSQEIYEEITENVLKKRARLRCMNLLQSMNRTEFQLREKLKQGGYPESIISQAIDYVRSYGYIDDDRYAREYIQCVQEKKSIRQIGQDLQRKGISREVIETAMSQIEPEDERKLIKKWIEKKRVNLDKATREEKQKLYMFLLRKGFCSADISKVLKGAEDFQ